MPDAMRGEAATPAAAASMNCLLDQHFMMFSLLVIRDARRTTL